MICLPSIVSIVRNCPTPNPVISAFATSGCQLGSNAPMSAQTASGVAARSTLSATIARVAAGAEIVTVIEGGSAPIPLNQLPLELPDGLELELHRGGQPHYWWLIAAQ